MPNDKLIINCRRCSGTGYCNHGLDICPECSGIGYMVLGKDIYDRQLQAEQKYRKEKQK